MLQLDLGDIVKVALVVMEERRYVRITSVKLRIKLLYCVFCVDSKYVCNVC